MATAFFLVQHSEFGGFFYVDVLVKTGYYNLENETNI